MSLCASATGEAFFKFKSIISEVFDSEYNWYDRRHALFTELIISTYLCVEIFNFVVTMVVVMLVLL